MNCGGVPTHHRTGQVRPSEKSGQRDQLGDAGCAMLLRTSYTEDAGHPGAGSKPPSLPDTASFRPACGSLCPFRGRREFDPRESSRCIPEPVGGDAVAIAQQVSQDLIEREGFPELLSGPLRSRVGGHVEMEDSTPVVGQYKECRIWKRSFRGLNVVPEAQTIRLSSANSSSTARLRRKDRKSKVKRQKSKGCGYFWTTPKCLRIRRVGG